MKINVSFLDEPPNILAFVYEKYVDFDFPDYFGISIITENGIDLGGFSIEEQNKYLEFVKDTDFEYEFRNVIQLDYDFESKIKPLFKI